MIAYLSGSSCGQSSPGRRTYLLISGATLFVLVQLIIRMSGLYTQQTQYSFFKPIPQATNRLDDNGLHSIPPQATIRTIPKHGHHPCFNEQTCHNYTINDTISKLEAILRDHIAQMEVVRKDLLASGLKWQAYTRSAQRIIGYKEDFFEELENHSYVSTVFFRRNFAEMKKLLIKTYYEYTSNDCELVEKRSVYGNHQGKEMFNIECHSNLELLLQGHPLTENHLNVGLPPHFDHHSDTEKVWTHMNVVKNAVVSVNGDVFAPNLTLVPQRCNSWKPGILTKDIESLPLHDEVFSVQQFWATRFYHSTLEGMPRLVAYLQFLRDNPQVKINLQFRKHHFLPLLGIPNLEARTLNRPFRGHVVYSPAGGPCGMSPLLTTQLLSLYAHRFLPNQPLLRDKIVLIKRSRKRYFKKHAAILAMLQEEAKHVGLNVVEFRDAPLPSPQATMTMFNEAVMVVAPHGAGESNLIFSQPGTVVIEGLCWDELHRGNLCYRNLAQVLGLRYHALFYNTQCMDITAEQVKEPVHFFLQHLHTIRST